METLELQGEDEKEHFNGHHIQYCCVNNNPKNCVETTTTNNTNAIIANLIKVSPKSFLSTLQNMGDEFLHGVNFQQGEVLFVQVIYNYEFHAALAELFLGSCTKIP